MEDAVAEDAVACSREIWYSLIVNTMEGGDSCIAVVSSDVHGTCSDIEVTT